MLLLGTPFQADYLTIDVIIDEPSYVEIGNILSLFIPTVNNGHHLKTLLKTPNEVLEVFIRSISKAQTVL